MTRSSSRQAADAPANPSPQDSAQAAAERQARRIAATLKDHGIPTTARVLNLCCGYGWHARILSRAGYTVVGVDIRHDQSVLLQWHRLTAEDPRLCLITGDVRHLPLRRKFDAVVLPGNSLTLFADNDDALRLLRQARRLTVPQGLLLLDNVCVSIWEEIAAGRYADGLSEDNLWQMAWLPGRNVFALRYGDQVRPDRPKVRRGEVVYRAWSLDELDLLCRLTGWTLDVASRRAQWLIAKPGTISK